MASKAPLSNEEQFRKGFYGDVTLAGAYNPTVDDFDRLKRTPYGLAPLWSSSYAYVKGASGRTYFPMRSSQSRHSTRLSITSALGWDGAVDAPEAKGTYRGYTDDAIVDGRWLITPTMARAGQGMSFSLEPGRGATWEEEGVLDLDFQWLGPASQLYHPDPVYDLYMHILLFKATGTLLGDPVEGMGVLEMAWGNGMCDYREIPMTVRASDQFILNVIQYADGGSEHSVLHPNFTRNGGAGTAIRDGKLLQLDGLQSEVELNDDLHPEKVRWWSGDHAWEATMETSSLASPKSPDWHWHCGRSRPADVDRKVAWSFCFAEVLPRAMAELRADVKS